MNLSGLVIEPGQTYSFVLLERETFRRHFKYKILIQITNEKASRKF
jgi:hypothetical protein